MSTTHDIGVAPTTGADMPADSFDSLAKAALERCAFHRTSAKDLERRYRRAGWFLSFFIPLTSAAITGLAATTAANASLHLGVAVTVLLGAMLTVATIVNSVLKPEQKYLLYTGVLIQLEDWEVGFRVALAELRSSPESNRLRLLEAKQK